MKTLLKKPILWAMLLTAGLGWAPTAFAAEPLPARLWNDLASCDESTAAHAARDLQSADAEAVVAFLRDRVHAVKSDEKRVASLIEQLDSPKFMERVRATEELEYLGKTIEPQLTKALAAAPALEVRRRLELLLSRFQPVAVALVEEDLYNHRFNGANNPVIAKPAVFRPRDGVADIAARLRDRDNIAIARPRLEEPEPNRSRNDIALQVALARLPIQTQAPVCPYWARTQRAVEILERIATPEAKKILVMLAEGDAEAAPTTAARNALGRLAAQTAQVGKSK